MNKKVKWGVIGCGGIAERRTIPGLVMAENAELIAVMDVNLEAAKRVKEKYNLEYAFDSVDELLEVEEIEAVYIATPVFCHLEQVKKTAEAKKHILLEKPMGLSVKEAEEIIEICKNAGVKLAAGFMMRYHAYHKKIHDLIKDGVLGQIVSARAQFSCWYPEMENVWRQKKAFSGGGALMDMAIHGTDLIRYITDLECVEVCAMTGNSVFKYEVEDSGGIVFRLENGAICYSEANFNIPDASSVSKLEFYGTKGSVTAYNTLSQEEGGKITLLCANDSEEYDAMQNRRTDNEMDIKVDFGNMYTKEIEAFSNSVLNDTEPFINGEDALSSQKIIEAAYISNSERKFVRI